MTVRDQVTLEVRNSHTQVLQASENLATLQNEILPALREAGELARRNYENGGTPYFLVLQTTGQYLDARLRELQLAADLRRAIAELDRSVGRKVGMSPVSRDQNPAVTTDHDSPQTIIGRNTDHKKISMVDEVSIAVQPVSHTSDSTNSQSKGWHATPK